MEDLHSPQQADHSIVPELATSLSADLLKRYPSLGRALNDEDYVEFGDGREDALLTHLQSRPALRNDPRAILAAIDAFSAQHDFLITIGADKGAKVAALVAQERPQLLLELGGYVGYSAVAWAVAMRGSGNAAGRVVSLEREARFVAVAREVVALAGLGDVVGVVVGEAAESMRGLARDGKGRVDFLFLDHVEELYERDLRVCEEMGLLRKGALVVADNVLRPGAPEYRAYVRAHDGFESWGVKGLIVPGEFEDELEVTRVL